MIVTCRHQFTGLGHANCITSWAMLQMAKIGTLKNPNASDAFPMILLSLDLCSPALRKRPLLVCRCQVLAVAAVLLSSWPCATAAALLCATMVLTSSRTGCRIVSSALHFDTPQAGLRCRKCSLMLEAPAIKTCLQYLHSTFACATCLSAQ